MAQYWQRELSGIGDFLQRSVVSDNSSFDTAFLTLKFPHLEIRDAIPMLLLTNARTKKYILHGKNDTALPHF